MIIVKSAINNKSYITIASFNFLLLYCLFSTSNCYAQLQNGGVVICNHWTQFGIGKAFCTGEVNGKWYNENFSLIRGFEQGRRFCDEKRGNKICHEIDAYALESISNEDPDYLRIIKNEIDSNRLELIGGTYGQPESQILGYESAIRQFTFGQRTLLKYTGNKAKTYLVEEQNFYSQLPQILLKTGFKYASLQFQNSGTPDPEIDELVYWKGLDNSRIITMPNNAGMVECTISRSDPEYKTQLEKVTKFKTPFIFQWVELWVPGYDWGATLQPYYKGLNKFYQIGFKPMLFTEFMDWAAQRTSLKDTKFTMDNSNYENNFYNGGWGYENEKTARGTNQIESLLLSLESICAADSSFSKSIDSELSYLWSRLLISQNHDPYLAGSVPAYINGLKSFQSELAVNEFNEIRSIVKDRSQITNNINKDANKVYIFNPCPWQVNLPIMMELNQNIKSNEQFTLNNKTLSQKFRSDNGNILLSPVMVNLGPYSMAEYTFKKLDENDFENKVISDLLLTQDNGKTWKVKDYEDINFIPLRGYWKLTNPFFYKPPIINEEFIEPDISKSEVSDLKAFYSDNCYGYTWKNDLMRIINCKEPAVSIENLAFAAKTDFTIVEFHQRLITNPVIQTGRKPDSTWKFRECSSNCVIVKDTIFKIS